MCWAATRIPQPDPVVNADSLNCADYRAAFCSNINTFITRSTLARFTVQFLLRLLDSWRNAATMGGACPAFPFTVAQVSPVLVKLDFCCPPGRIQPIYGRHHQSFRSFTVHSSRRGYCRRGS